MIELIPFTGYGQIKFGQSQEQVKLLLGEPTETVREKHEDGTEDISYLYSEEGVELSFMSEDDYSLGLITCYLPTYTIEGKSFIGLSGQDFLSEANFSDLALEDDFSDVNAKDYTVDSMGISIWIQDDHVHSITLFPRYNDADEVVWPE